MKTFLRKYSILLSTLTILVLLTVTWLFPAVAIIIASTFMLLSLSVIVYSTIGKQKEAYTKGQITKVAFMRNVTLEIVVILLTMLLAAVLGDSIARIATSQIGDILTKFLIGILIGLLVGIGLGFLVKRAWDKLSLSLVKSRPNPTE